MSMWHCNEHGLTGPMACCEKASRVAVAAAIPVVSPTGITVTVPLRCAEHSGMAVYRLDANGRCIGCGKTAALIRAEDDVSTTVTGTRYEDGEGPE